MCKEAVRMERTMQNDDVFRMEEMTRSSCLERSCHLKNFYSFADSYGGNQDWFEEFGQDRYSALRACGIIALLNQFASLGLAYPEARRLWPENGLPENKSDYIQWAYTLRPYIWPGPIGLPRGSVVRQASMAYAADRGVNLAWKQITGRPSAEKEIAFIRAGLESHVPVGHLVWRSGFEDLTWHWIVITALSDDPEGCINITPEMRKKYEGDLYMICSSFGRKEGYPLHMVRKAFPFHRELQYPVLV